MTGGLRQGVKRGPDRAKRISEKVGVWEQRVRMSPFASNYPPVRKQLLAYYCVPGESGDWPVGHQGRCDLHCTSPAGWCLSYQTVTPARHGGQPPPREKVRMGSGSHGVGGTGERLGRWLRCPRYPLLPPVPPHAPAGSRGYSVICLQRRGKTAPV